MKETDVFTQNELVDWWTSAIPGDIAIYYRGFLMGDRDPNKSKLLPNARLDMIDTARIAWAMMSEGRVYLFQRRRHDTTEYLAMKAARTGVRK